METKIYKLNEIDTTKNPFKVPDDYFAQLNEEIMNRLPEKETVAPKPVSLWDRAKPWLYLAAMFVGLNIMINFLLKTPEGNNPDESPAVAQQIPSGNLDNVTEEEFYQYLEEQLVDDNYFDYMYHQYYLN
jgi:hypothetical protein